MMSDFWWIFFHKTMIWYKKKGQLDNKYSKILDISTFLTNLLRIREWNQEFCSFEQL